MLKNKAYNKTSLWYQNSADAQEKKTAITLNEQIEHMWPLTLSSVNSMFRTGFPY